MFFVAAYTPAANPPDDEKEKWGVPRGRVFLGAFTPKDSTRGEKNMKRIVSEPVNDNGTLMGIN